MHRYRVTGRMSCKVPQDRIINDYVECNTRKEAIERIKKSRTPHGAIDVAWYSMDAELVPEPAMDTPGYLLFCHVKSQVDGIKDEGMAELWFYDTERERDGWESAARLFANEARETGRKEGVATDG